MNFFIDTTGKFLALAVFDKHFKLIDSQISEIKNKADHLPELVSKILFKNNLKITEFTAFFINLGPGNFTGCRIGLTFFRTFAQIRKKELWTCSSFSLLSFRVNENKQYFIDYSEKSQFSAFAKNGKITSEIFEIKEKFEKGSEINYNLIFLNFGEAKKLFKKENDLINIFPLYIK
ncbi:tRNA threonylcarbamoyladenosine biosynthesis protein TsaB [Mesomycoplasma flocculare]|uniref:Gcp-like domain-containing protein n=1 Tax=Mesomycoplasma flocculare ATCC 27399 TaxID=743971 RepID=A0A0A8E7W6_MESFC|nr:tRNA threonylcarbamoyladenosine biosynthesis protein TsaB [Mesomycoplasma flocculare]AJC49702.1 hypothetical protein MYF_00735 [Mesomycoplasma flocculare ATCC 27399]ENX51093.1 hypothetical protein MFC_01354 [Mesomycoplasma flocculare ATCC 27716]MXR22709.1 tRNA (adenosine(37)-N6)-threonylcarbamoyltransferase complex dimerization subunit type 1 TsaB [Mesomycoplasma flocculare]